MDEGFGCFGALLMAVLIGWVPLHFSGKSFLYYRDTVQKTGLSGGKVFIVTCHYFNSTGLEERIHVFEYESSKNGFYCQRMKDVGQ
jgi:hypothetical protein